MLVSTVPSFEMESIAEFDGGICCIIRADPMYFQAEEMLRCTQVETLDANFVFIENEELIAHIIRLDATVKRVKVRSGCRNAS